MNGMVMNVVVDIGVGSLYVNLGLLVDVLYNIC